jgi:hypothetical protein
LNVARATILLSAALLLGSPAVAIGDPGTPGVEAAQNAVYPQPGGGGNVGQLDTTGGGGPGQETGDVEGRDRSGGEGAPGGEGQPSPEGEDSVGADSGDVGGVSVSGDEASKLPFTGLSALLLLALGLGTVISSAVLRRLAKRPEHA